MTRKVAHQTSEPQASRWVASKGTRTATSTATTKGHCRAIEQPIDALLTGLIDTTLVIWRGARIPVSQCSGGRGQQSLNPVSAVPRGGLCVILGSMCVPMPPPQMRALDSYELSFGTPCDSALQVQLESVDAMLRARHGMTPEHTAVGVLDLQTLRLAMIRPDRIEYAASVPKIGILLAYFHLHPDAGANLDARTRHELGLMIKASSNEMAAKYSRELGLKRIQSVLDSYHFYDANHGGGLWVGKHYDSDAERFGDPIGAHSHAATVRQLLRFYLMLEQGRLVSPAASQTMRKIFASPDIPHDPIKFVKGLAGRDVQLLRKWGTWEDWRHDTAIVTGPSRHYILVALTHHPNGDDYLVELAREVDDAMAGDEPRMRRVTANSHLP